MFINIPNKDTNELIPYFVPDQYKDEPELYIPIKFIRLIDEVNINQSLLDIQNELVSLKIFTNKDLDTDYGKRNLMKLIQKYVYNKIKRAYNK
jgi:hypothetical protein